MGRNQNLVTAYHEAGHVVAAWCCGIKVRSASVNPSATSLGQTVFDFSLDQRLALAQNHPIFLRSLAVVGVGGMAADYIYWRGEPVHDEDEPITGDSGDQLQVRKYLDILGHNGEKDFDAYLGTAINLIGRKPIWKIVEKVAAALAIHGQLNAVQLEQLASPTIIFTQSDWELLERSRKLFGSEDHKT